jgi:nucleotide-binding universal stress UspA family protein
MPHIKRLLVPTDYSATSDLALGYAIDLARRYGASIHLVHVVEDIYFANAYPDGFFAELPALRARLIADAETRLGEDADRCTAASVVVSRQVIDGRPARVIVQLAAERGDDLIVMGTQGRSGVAHMLLGSVAEHVVRTAPCPVFTVRDSAHVADAVVAATARPATAPPSE